MVMSLKHRFAPWAKVAVAALAVAALGVVAVPARAEIPPDDAQRRFTVMTYNLYLGANLQPLFGKSGLELIEEAAKVFAHVVQTDFPSRAEAIAKLIAQEQPAVVGLQEVALWQTAPLGAPGQLETVSDFEEILLNALERQGLGYRAAVENVDFSAALPISLTTLGSFTDRNVILVRDELPPSQLKVTNVSAQNFQASLPVPIGGGTIDVTRGWAAADVKFRGKTYRVADTHLEAFSVDVRNAQAHQLASALATSPVPVVLLGDLNSLPDDPTGSFAIMRAAGFVDGWVEAMDGTACLTAGQTDDLDNVPSLIDHTVDYVMHNQDGFLDAVAGSGDVAGEELDDRTPSGLWPSDHAGVALTMHIAEP